MRLQWPEDDAVGLRRALLGNVVDILYGSLRPMRGDSGLSSNQVGVEPEAASMDARRVNQRCPEKADGVYTFCGRPGDKGRRPS